MRLPSDRPRTWLAERVGDSVEGILVRTEPRQDKNSKTHMVAVLRSSLGVEHAVWLFVPGIGWNWEEAGPPMPGDAVRIERLQDRQHIGKTFRDFAVEVVSRAKPIRADKRAMDLDEGNPF